LLPNSIDAPLAGVRRFPAGVSRGSGNVAGTRRVPGAVETGTPLYHRRRMPITVADAVAALGRTAPWGKAGGWDPVGLQLGDPHATVSSIAVAHELTEAFIAGVDSSVVAPVTSDAEATPAS
jgi:hypothetical protein